MKIWYTLFIYLFVESITPGPNNLTCLYLGATYGINGTRKFMTASMICLLIKALLCGLLNMVLAKYIPAAVVYLKWAGAAYMIYLAWCMMKSGWQEENKDTPQQTESTYRSGVMLQLLNAKSWIVSLSMFAVYIIPIDSGIKTIIWTSLVFYVFAYACSLIWAAFGSALKKVISEYKKPFGVVMGLSLLYCAVMAVI